MKHDPDIWKLRSSPLHVIGWPRSRDCFLQSFVGRVIQVWWDLTEIKWLNCL